MIFARVTIAAIALAAAASAASAQSLEFKAGLRSDYAPSYAGLKDMSDIPAPIPVPMAHPVPEGFSYYLRTDFIYGAHGKRPSFEEWGRTYGAGGGSVFIGTSSFSYGGSGFSSLSEKTADTLAGGFGFGAYFSPRLRGDVTVEFRGERATDVYGTYSYTSTSTGTVSGSLHDSFRMLSTVGLINGYIDLLPRGAFTPYVGGGVGIVYHQINRSYLARETQSSNQLDITGEGSTSRVAFAAAATAGMSFAFDHRWAIDVNYRALYLQGASVNLTTRGLSTNQVSTATLGDTWEHQVRVGLRFNIW